MRGPYVNPLPRWIQFLQRLLIDLGEAPSLSRCDDLLLSLGMHARVHVHHRSLYQHLCGTREILSAWGQPLWIQLAGLFHSVYVDDIVIPESIRLQNRRLLRSTMGTKAERVVYLYSQIKRQTLLEGTFGTDRGVGPDSITTTDDQLDRESIVALLLITIASDVEEATASGSGPSTWIAQIYKYVDQAKRISSKPILAIDGLSSVSDEGEHDLISSYETALDLVHKDTTAALTHLDHCSRICSFLFEPWVWKAYLAALQHDYPVARESAERAMVAIERWSVVWDRRITKYEWRIAIERLASSPTWDEGAAAVLSRVLRRVEDAKRNASRPTVGDVVSDSLQHNDKTERIVSYMGNLSRDRDGDICSYYPAIRNRLIYTGPEFPIVDALQKSFAAIRAEIFSLSDDCFTPTTGAQDVVGRMETFTFYEGGRRYPSSFVFCAALGEIIDGFSDVLRTGVGHAHLIKLRPHTYLGPHKESSNICVHVVLPIYAQNHRCGIHFDATTVTWTEGKCLVFDGSVMHEEWNDGDIDCVLLDVTLWHPDIPNMDRQMIEGLHKVVEAQAEQLNRRWIASDLQRLSNGAAVSQKS